MIPEPALYLGRVMHHRMSPARHGFRYRVFSVLVDIDHAPRARLLSRNRFNLLSVHDRDHGPRDGSPLRPWVEAQLSARGIAAPERVLLMSFPRLWGYVFNPLSIFFCYRAGALEAVIYEVKNTFGDQVAYVIPTPDEGARARHGQDKAMYVSPFLELEHRYGFTLSAPGERFALRIRAGALIATHHAEARPLRDRAILAAVARHPLMTLKVIAGIHWEALRLVLKGVRFHRYSKSRIWATERLAEDVR